MIRLAQKLISHTQDPGIAKSITKPVNSIRSRLAALVLSATAAGDGSPLPEKENIGPNQLSWPETAARMGVKRSSKRQGKGKVDSALTAQHIGEPNRKRAADNDPYGAGEQSGKRAKPDARSAAANSRARAAQELKTEPPPSQPLPSQPLPSQPPPSTPLVHPPSTPLPLPSSMPPPHISFTPYAYNYHFHPPPAPLSQPMYQYPPSQTPSCYRAFPYSTYSYHAT
jgi:hypothetical protein